MKFNFKKAKKFDDMFLNCYSLKNLDCSDEDIIDQFNNLNIH